MKMPANLIDFAADSTPRPRKGKGRRTFVADANAALQALLLKYGVEAAIAAVEESPYKSKSYKSVVKRLHEFAGIRLEALKEFQAKHSDTK